MGKQQILSRKQHVEECWIHAVITWWKKHWLSCFVLRTVIWYGILKISKVCNRWTRFVLQPDAWKELWTGEFQKNRPVVYGCKARFHKETLPAIAVVQGKGLYISDGASYNYQTDSQNALRMGFVSPNEKEMEEAFRYWDRWCKTVLKQQGCLLPANLGNLYY